MVQKNVIAFLRVSTVAQADEGKDGIPTQKEVIGELVESFGLTVVETVKLIGTSGAYVAESKEFQKMLMRLRDPNIHGIVFAYIDRFYRPSAARVLSSGSIFKEFEDNEKFLYCDLCLGKYVNRGLQPSELADAKVIRDWGDVASAERTRIAERLKRSNEQARKSPNRTPDKPPFFVLWDKLTKTFSWNRDAADRLRQAFEQFDNGESLKHLITLFDPVTEIKSHNSLRNAFQNPWVLGMKGSRFYRKYPKQRTLDDLGRLKDGSKAKRGEDPTKPIIMVATDLAADPIVPKPLWDRVQAKLAVNAAEYKTKKARENPYLASGIMRCGCGRIMHTKIDRTERKKRKPTYYRCSSNANGNTPCGYPHLPASTVDEAIIMSLGTWFLDQTFIEANLRKRQDPNAVADIERLIKAKEKQIVSFETDMNNFGELAGRAKTPTMKAMYNSKAEAADDKLQVAQGELAQLRMTAEATMTEAQIKTTAKDLTTAFSGWGKWSTDKLKEVLRAHVAWIYMENGAAEFVVKAGVPLPSFSSYRAAKASIMEVVGNELSE